MFYGYVHEKIVGLFTFGLATIVTLPSISIHDTLVHGIINLFLALTAVVITHFLKIGLNKISDKYFKNKNRKDG